MILGYHFILSAYGFWLPNDPRGSWSEIVREFELRKFGPATKVDTTRSVASRPHDHQLRLAAKRALRYPAVRFTGEQVVLIAKGFADAVLQHSYVIHALAILPDHVHLVMRKHPSAASQLEVRVGKESSVWETSVNTEVSHAQKVYCSSDGEGTSDIA